MPLIASLLAAAAAGGAGNCPVEEAALNAAAEVIARQYVVAETAGRLADDLRQRIRSAAYADSCTDPEAFIVQVNRDLDVYDGHFHFERVQGAETGGDDWLMAWRSGSREANAGVREVRVLDGNVGYLRLASFYPWDLAKPKLAAALGMLGDVDALILDLRQNGGGDAITAGQVLRTLLGPGPVSVQDIDRRGARSQEPLPAAELPVFPTARPVAVLIDRRSASASEFVAYSLQAEKRAIVVGDRSAGAAHMFGEPVRLPGGYALTIPDARPLNRNTADNWEGSGVVPDLRGGDDPIHRARVRLADILAARR